MPNAHQSTETPSPTGTPVLLRIFWMLFGNIVLILAALSIVVSESGRFLSVGDIVYWVIAPLVIAARYIDIARYGGTTADGEPTTLAHWRRYAILYAVMAVAIWFAAHGVAFVVR